MSLLGAGLGDLNPGSQLPVSQSPVMDAINGQWGFDLAWVPEMLL